MFVPLTDEQREAVAAAILDFGATPRDAARMAKAGVLTGDEFPCGIGTAESCARAEETRRRNETDPSPRLTLTESWWQIALHLQQRLETITANSTEETEACDVKRIERLAKALKPLAANIDLIGPQDSPSPEPTQTPAASDSNGLEEAIARLKMHDAETPTTDESPKHRHEPEPQQAEQPEPEPEPKPHPLGSLYPLAAAQHRTTKAPFSQSG